MEQSRRAQQYGAKAHVKQMPMSEATKEKVKMCKDYISNKYKQMKQDEEEKKMTWQLIMQQMESLNMSQQEQEGVKQEIMHKEAILHRTKRKKIKAKDFEPLAIIGKGAFGEVRLCRDKVTKELLAIKKMNKSEMVQKKQITHILAERDILASSNNPWVVGLKCSFTDEKNLYLVMEFLQGGDLMTLLIKKDVMTEDEAKFYTAQIILAVDSVHRMNFIHRDLKPDNILIDKQGHIKLSDFGLCKNAEIKPRLELGVKNNNSGSKQPQQIQIDFKKMLEFQKKRRQLAFSTVGTPDYIAPEVFTQKGYNETIDWWSVGVILFEMLVGYPPFFSDQPNLTCQKILHWQKTFSIPDDAKLSQDAANLIKALISDPNERLGVNGVDEIKVHPFFKGVDWKRLREQTAPYIPTISSEIDTQNFDKFEEDPENPWIMPKAKIVKNRQDDMYFRDFTRKKNIQSERSLLVDALENLEKYRQSNQRVQQQKSEEKRPSQPDPQEGHFQSQHVMRKQEEIKMKKQLIGQKGNLKTNNPQYKQLIQNNQSKTNNKDVQNLINQYVQRKEQKNDGVLRSPQINKMGSPTNRDMNSRLNGLINQNSQNILKLQQSQQSQMFQNSKLRQNVLNMSNQQQVSYQSRLSTQNSANSQYINHLKNNNPKH